MQWAQVHGATVVISSLAAWLLGMERGYKGAALRVKIMIAALFAYVGVPVILYYFKLETLWIGVLSALIGAQGTRIIKWFELVSLKRMGITPRGERWDGTERREGAADESGEGNGE
jgi:hypothetical protein